MIETFTPLGVGSEYSCRRSGYWAGHLRLIGKAASEFIGISLGGNPHDNHLPGILHGSSLRNMPSLLSPTSEPKWPSGLLSALNGEWRHPVNKTRNPQDAACV